MKKRILRIYSRHSSHDPLRKSVLVDGLAMIRFGSTTKPLVKYDVEINSIQSVKNSASKLLMKQCFSAAGVKTAEWWKIIDGEHELLIFKNGDIEPPTNMKDLPYPLIAKHHFGSRGTGNYKLNSAEELQKWMEGRDMSKYLFEKFYSHSKEFRLHCAKGIGCFYACRKMLKTDVPKERRWTRHSTDVVWILEDNEAFEKPLSWNLIEQECLKALDSLGADVMAFDIKVQSAKNSEGTIRENPDFFIIESNSAPSLLSIGIEKYKEYLPKVVKFKRFGKHKC